MPVESARDELYNPPEVPFRAVRAWIWIHRVIAPISRESARAKAPSFLGALVKSAKQSLIWVGGCKNKMAELVDGSRRRRRSPSSLKTFILDG
jgi:hypothetical protein